MPLSRSNLHFLWEEAESVLYRMVSEAEQSVLVLAPSEHATPAFLERIENEYALRDRLDRRWAALPLALELLKRQIVSLQRRLPHGRILRQVAVGLLKPGSLVLELHAVAVKTGPRSQVPSSFDDTSTRRLKPFSRFARLKPQL
jgi:hypothetical protein